MATTQQIAVPIDLRASAESCRLIAFEELRRLTEHDREQIRITRLGIESDIKDEMAELAVEANATNPEGSY